MRISAQLIETATGSHLWAEHYDRDAVDILAVQDEIVRAIATALGYQIEAAGRERALRSSPDALSAYDYVLRSEAFLMRYAKDDNAEARRWAETAVELDPERRAGPCSTRMDLLHGLYLRLGRRPGGRRSTRPTCWRGVPFFSTKPTAGHAGCWQHSHLPSRV